MSNNDSKILYIDFTDNLKDKIKYYLDEHSDNFEEIRDIVALFTIQIFQLL